MVCISIGMPLHLKRTVVAVLFFFEEGVATVYEFREMFWKCSAANVHGWPPYLFAIDQTDGKTVHHKMENKLNIDKILNADTEWTDNRIHYAILFELCEIIWFVAFNLKIDSLAGNQSKWAERLAWARHRMCVCASSQSAGILNIWGFMRASKMPTTSCICIANRNSINKSITKNLFKIRCICERFVFEGGTFACIISSMFD